VLRRAAFVAVALLATGCGSAEKAGEPPSVTRHIVYDHVLGQEGIWIADVDGRNPRRLAASGLMPEISPDGKWVVYVLAGWSCEFSFEPIAIDPLTGAVRRIEHGSAAVALSADGQYALVQASWGAETPREELKVLVVPFEGGNPTVVVKGLPLRVGIARRL
jgi:hypothetical protein